MRQRKISDAETSIMGGIMFYTDTNGQLPISCIKALVLLGIAMESMPLDQIDFEVFKEIDPRIDSELLGLLRHWGGKNHKQK